MKLDQVEREMLSGRRGRAVQWAMEFMVEVGEYFGAERMVGVTSALVLADVEIMGLPGADLIAGFAHEGVRFCCPSMTAPGVEQPELGGLLGLNVERAELQRSVNRDLCRMGAEALDTCIPYQWAYRPRVGEHLAWADTGAVCYANSVLGAQANFESGPASLAAGLTGRVPEYGFHLQRHRRGTVLVQVEVELHGLADWGALGAYVGRQVTDYWQVPIIEGLGARCRPDELKHLAASLGAVGSIAMFGLVGVTPEAMTLGAAFADGQPERVIKVGPAEIDGLYRLYMPVTEDVEAVVLSAPQLSLEEIGTIAEMLEGQRVHDGTQLILTTCVGVLRAAEGLGYVSTIERAGGAIITGICLYHVELDRIVERFGWRQMVTNSVKLANNVAPFDIVPVLRSTEECVAAAIEGRLSSHGRNSEER